MIEASRYVNISSQGLKKGRQNSDARTTAMSSKNADDAGRSGQYFNKKTTKPEFVGGFSTSA